MNRYFEFTMHSVKLGMGSTNIRCVMILIGETHIPGGHGSCRGLEGAFFFYFSGMKKFQFHFLMPIRLLTMVKIVESFSQVITKKSTKSTPSSVADKDGLR